MIKRQIFYLSKFIEYFEKLVQNTLFFFIDKIDYNYWLYVSVLKYITFFLKK